jgi:hypothetical protein
LAELGWCAAWEIESMNQYSGNVSDVERDLVKYYLIFLKGLLGVVLFSSILNNISSNI